MIPIPEQKIDRLVREMRHYNIFPVFLERVDCSSTRPHPICSALTGVLSDLKDYLLAATDAEVKATYEAIFAYYRDQLTLDDLLKRREDVVERAAFALVITLTQQKYHNVADYLSGSYRSKSSVLEVYPELGANEDEEGLLSLSVPNMHPDRFGSCIYYKQHIIYYHQFLRRGFRSNPNYPFLSELVLYHQRHPDHRVMVAIDHLRLATREHAQIILEKARSFGPPLKRGALDDPHEVGLTVYRPNPGHWAYSEVDRTEFFWSYRDGVKTLQIEEVWPLDPDGQPSRDYVLSRYVHSRRDVTAHSFVHLDGAVKVYPRAQWDRRFHQQLPNVAKVKDKLKMFRVDGDIPDDEWSRLTSLFFQDNLMVPEYLNPDFEAEG